MKLFYFDSKGRAETARAVLHLGGVDFEDVRIKREEWPTKYKAMSPTGQCPWLELDDGSTIAQSLACNIHCASLAGYLPAEPLQIARTTELHCCFEDVMGTIMPSFGIQDLEGRVAARKEIMAEGGKMHKALATVDKLAAKVKTDFYCGDEPTLADVHIFCFLSATRSGFLDGISKADVDQFEHVAALRSKVAALPKVNEMYAESGGFEP